MRLCSYGAVGSAAKLAQAGVGQAGGAVLQRMADAARSSGSSRVRLAASVADNVVRTVAQRADRTVTAAEQTQLVQALAELDRTEAVNLGPTTVEDALARGKAIVASILRQLEGDTIYLPGTPRGQYLKVTLGKRLGRGAFGWVFEVMENGQPGNQALKVIGNNWTYLENDIPLPPITDALVNNMGADSLRVQVEGANILQRLGIPTPKIGYVYTAAKRGEFSFALMERIDTNAPNIDIWEGTKFSVAAKRAAIEQLHQRLGGAGYIAADLAPRNVYFVLQNGAVRAGVWDADLIVAGRPSELDAATRARFLGYLGGAADGNNLTKMNYADLFDRIDYTNAPEAMQSIQKIQWGF
jgi:hypothetical protein